MTQSTNTPALKIIAALEARIDQEAEDQARKEVAGLNRTILDGLDKLGLMTVSPHAFVCRAHEVRKQHLVDELTHQAISNLMPGTIGDRSDSVMANVSVNVVMRDGPSLEPIASGELLPFEPDPRLDEIIVLLKQLVKRAEMSANTMGPT